MPVTVLSAGDAAVEQNEIFALLKVSVPVGRQVYGGGCDILGGSFSFSYNAVGLPMQKV